MAAAIERASLNLALQGGGAHGAFTWGVLDRVLEDDRIDFDGASGASAGAVNAVLLAAGLREGGPAGAPCAEGLIVDPRGELRFVLPGPGRFRVAWAVSRRGGWPADAVALHAEEAATIDVVESASEQGFQAAIAPEALRAAFDELAR